MTLVKEKQKNTKKETKTEPTLQQALASIRTAHMSVQESTTVAWPYTQLA